MPIDPSIYQLVKEPPSAIQTMADVAKLRNAQLAEQIGQQRLQSEAFDLQQKQRTERTKAMLSAAVARHMNPDGSWNRQAITKDLADSGYEDIPGAMALMDEFEASSTKLNNAKLEGKKTEAELDGFERKTSHDIGAIAQHILDTGGSLEDAAGMAHTLVAGSKSIPDEHKTTIAQGLDPANPEQSKRTIQALFDADPEAAQKYRDAKALQPFALREQEAKALKEEQAVQGTTPRTPQQIADDAEQEAVRKETHRHNVAMENRPVGGSGSGTAGDVDPNIIADEIINGNQPPTLTGLYRNGAAVKTALGRKGFNLTQATSDWQSLTKYIATLNGAQQTRLRQATEFVRETVPLVRDLSSELTKRLPRSQFPLLNKAALVAARNGVMGKEAQDAATKLQSQIADMQSELAVMYRGGNAATDEALKKATDMLKSDWSENQLKAALDLIEKNSQIRLNSIKNVTVATPGMEPNRYAPIETPAKTPTKRFNPATGQVEDIK